MSASTFRAYSRKELRVSRAIYRAMKRSRGALVEGAPTEGQRTLIDGTFDLRAIAVKVLAEIDKTPKIDQTL